VLEPQQRRRLLEQHIEPTLRRELLHRGIISEEKGYSADLIGWVEVAPARSSPTGERPAGGVSNGASA
jgi:hypothetical protein